MTPRALIAILAELQLTHPKLVLVQGTDYWRIEDLLKQARKDRRVEAEPLEAPLYVADTDRLGKISIINAQSGTIVFSEVGAETTAPAPA